jgi:hypothetical protein
MKPEVITTGTWGNHRNCYRVKKLAVGEPVVLLDDSSVEKRNDRKAAPEYESSSFDEEE